MESSDLRAEFYENLENYGIIEISDDARTEIESLNCLLNSSCYKLHACKISAR